MQPCSPNMQPKRKKELQAVVERLLKAANPKRSRLRKTSVDSGFLRTSVYEVVDRCIAILRADPAKEADAVLRVRPAHTRC